MIRTHLTMFAIAVALAGTALTATQPSQEDDRRAALRVMRSINTAENAARAKGGTYLSLIDLMTHPSMGGVAPDMKVAGTTVSASPSSATNAA